MNTCIFITVFDRLDKLRNCINSLKANAEIKEIPLLISSDTTDNPVKKEKINDVRKYISSITGFKEVIPFFAKEPTHGGIINETWDYIFTHYDTVIFSEDDNIFAPDFLKFMLEGLNKYKNHPQVYSISGFSHSIFFDIPQRLYNETYFSQRFNPWGFGSWIEKLKKRDNIKIYEVEQFLNTKQFKQKLDAVGIDRLPQLNQILRKNREIPYDYLTGLHMIKNDIYSVYPYLPKSFNTGNDGSGERSAKSHKFTDIDFSFLDQPNDFRFFDEIEGHIDNSFHYRFYNTSFYRLKRLLSYLGIYDFAYKFKRLYRR